MAIVRNIDVTAQSEVSFDEACRTVVTEAAKTLRGIMSFRISEPNASSSTTRSSPTV